MEKKLPHYDLATIKATFTSALTLNITRTGLKNARALGFEPDGIVLVVQSMTRPQFYKSMTSDLDSSIWQDVYHVPHGDIVIYVKFTTDSGGYLLISFKEK